MENNENFASNVSVRVPLFFCSATLYLICDLVPFSTLFTFIAGQGTEMTDSGTIKDI